MKIKLIQEISFVTVHDLKSQAYSIIHACIAQHFAQTSPDYGIPGHTYCICQYGLQYTALNLVYNISQSGLQHTYKSSLQQTYYELQPLPVGFTADHSDLHHKPV